MSQRRFGRLRHEDRDAVATDDAAAAQRVRELIGARLQIVEAVTRGATVAMLIDQREPL